MPNIDNNLIIVKGEDKTSSILSFVFEKQKPVVWITYNSGKKYPYNTADVLFFKNPVTTEIEDRIVLKNGVPKAGVTVVQRFDTYCRLIFKNNYAELVKADEIKIIDSALNNPNSKTCFDYLKQIAYQVGLCAPDGHNILGTRYSKIDFVREDSILASFLSGNLTNNCYARDKVSIFPFGFNISQKQAVDNALNCKISVIEGPPGTGKTQTILNIIANAIMRGESAAVVSGNNSATANVLQKLQKYGFGFIAAPLGSKDNKNAFIENQSSTLPDMSFWKLGTLEYLKKTQKLIAELKTLNRMLLLKNELSTLLQEQETVKKESTHYKDYAAAAQMQSFRLFNKSIKASQILSFSAEYELLTQKGIDFSFAKKLIWLFKYGILSFAFLEEPVEEVLAYCYSLYYERRAKELDRRVAKIEKALEAYNFKEKLKEYSELSAMLFRAKLAERFSGVKSRALYSEEDLRTRSEAFIKDYPVVLSTTYSLRASLSNEFVYDYVIIDEASQVDLATGALALSCAKKVVVVGDLKQLPNVVDSEQKNATDKIFDKFNLREAYRYSNHSLLSSIIELFEDVPRVLLREHYRCHPEIIGFCNQRFYNNELIILTNAQTDKQPMMVYKTVAGNHARDPVNQRQIDVIMNEVVPQQHLNLDDSSVGIVTPYRAQADELQRTFAGTSVKADTADKFQGQERSVIILSTVDNEITDFASDPNRLNVAVSRAIDQLIVVTDGNETDHSSGIHELIGYIQYNNHDIINSQVFSVFDYLYHNYSEEREHILRKYGRVTDVESENLMYAVIRDVLQEEEFSRYDVVAHVPLRMLLRDLQKLNKEELMYATNHLTHVDFLIFSKLTHLPVLIIEVDGFAFHQKNEKQTQRDKIKNSILQKYNIPIVRLSTVGSNEKSRLEETLKAISN